MQMAFAMAKLKRLKSGAFSARKVIPKDVGDEYHACFGADGRSGSTRSRGTSLGDAKRRENEWLAQIEARIEAIRAAAGGRGRSLTHREALALAGEWYVWFVGRYEDEPGDPEGWEEPLNGIQRLFSNIPKRFFACELRHILKVPPNGIVHIVCQGR
jgi:hypothetical protein